MAARTLRARVDRAIDRLAAMRTAEQHVVIIYHPGNPDAWQGGTARVMLPAPGDYIKRIILTHEHNHATATPERDL